MKLEFFKAKDYLKSWSVWAMGAIGGFATLDFSSTYLDSIVPEQYKPVVYGALTAIGLVARSIKQPKIK